MISEELSAEIERYVGATIVITDIGNSFKVKVKNEDGDGLDIEPTENLTFEYLLPALNLIKAIRAKPEYKKYQAQYKDGLKSCTD